VSRFIGRKKGMGRGRGRGKGMVSRRLKTRG
jgi:hypothetical protein